MTGDDAVTGAYRGEKISTIVDLLSDGVADEPTEAKKFLLS